MEHQHQSTRQRTDLLRQHLREIRESIGREKQARIVLVQQHQLDQDQLLITYKKNSLEWAVLVVNQATRLVGLSSDYIGERKAIIDRHRDEVLELEQQIELKKNSLQH